MVGYYWGKAVLFIVCRQYHNETTIIVLVPHHKRRTYCIAVAAFPTPKNSNAAVIVLCFSSISFAFSSPNFVNVILPLS